MYLAGDQKGRNMFLMSKSESMERGRGGVVRGEWRGEGEGEGEGESGKGEWRRGSGEGGVERGEWRGGSGGWGEEQGRGGRMYHLSIILICLTKILSLLLVLNIYC